MGFSILAIALIVGITGWLLIRKINDRVSLQINLDQSSGTAVIQLRACLITFEESRERVRKAKIALTLACAANPIQCPTLKAYSDSMNRVEERLQNWAKIRWNLERAKLKTSHPPPELEVISKQGFCEVKVEQDGLISEAKAQKSMTPKQGSQLEWKIAWSK